MAKGSAVILALFTNKSPEGKDLFAKWSDEALIQEIVEHGDSKLFGHLYDRYSSKVYNKCYSFVKNRDEAKDLTHDIFLRAYLKIHGFDPLKAAFSTWLYVITYNLCANYVTRDLKEKQKETLLGKKELKEKGYEDIDIEEINKLNPEKLALALDRIPTEDKALLLLKYQDDASIKSIQELLGVGESAVKMRLNRAKLKVVKTYNSL
ncbi:RNA polymerase sigma factor [Flagellimonas meishanensis]|uniref:RNA polymerase sigma factor n=1 Tax=Flagellimonas meishanensis TaxID=2873264 RepID=UPI001CA62D7F|nr:RNA polymerase sigma factor [[Muricauda] meishanensis]